MPSPGALGPLAKAITKGFGLAFGLGLAQNIMEGYRYLMEHYEEGDRVFLFGFSRGAHTARALAGMLFKCGLLTSGSGNMTPYAYRLYAKPGNESLMAEFRQTFSRPCPVTFLGLWDTVTSVGWAWNPKTLPYTRFNPRVVTVRHAIAIDERRAKFRQNLWGQAPGQSVKQVWFAGVHCDVGGSYKEEQSGLSKLALQWMVREAAASGLQVDPAAYARVLQRGQGPDHKAKQHESLHGLWWLIEYLPLPYYDMSVDPPVRRWRIYGGRRRTMVQPVTVHQSVVDRLRDVPEYRPSNLPDSYSVEP
jgi:uncharacterized protein (DUF2235 family)